MIREKTDSRSACFRRSIFPISKIPFIYDSVLHASSTLSKLNEFTTMIRSFSAQLETRNAYELGEHIASQSGLLKELYTDRTPEGVARYENIQELLNGMKEFTDQADENGDVPFRSLADFLIDVALLTDVDNEVENVEGTVSLMTIHAAKGLEFPYVNIVGLEENLFPSQFVLNSREELEEERRLFYVALTRAEKQVTLSYAITRYRWGQLQYCEPSRFIEEIDPAYLDKPEYDRNPRMPQVDFSDERSGFFGRSNGNSIKKITSPPTKKTSTPTSLPPRNFKPVGSVVPEGGSAEGPFASAAEIVVGLEVMHEKFGKGKVLSVEGKAPDVKATIFFPSAGQKQLLLKFAKLRIA